MNQSKYISIYLKINSYTPVQGICFMFRFLNSIKKKKIYCYFNLTQEIHLNFSFHLDIPQMIYASFTSNLYRSLPKSYLDRTTSNTTSDDVFPSSARILLFTSLDALLFYSQPRSSALRSV